MPVKEKKIIKNIAILWAYLGKGRSTKIFLFFVLMLLVVVAEMISIGSVIPFLTALSNPEALLENLYFSQFLASFEIESSNEVLLPITLGFIAITVLSGCLRVLLLWANSKLTLATSLQLRTNLYDHALGQPYDYHISNNSSELISLLTDKVGFVVISVVMHTMLLLTSVVTSIGIIVALLWINTKIAILVFLLLGGGYWAIAQLLKRQIRGNGGRISKYNPISIKYVQEGVGGIKDVIIDNSQSHFSQLFKSSTYKAQSAIIENSFLANLPKPILEVFGIILIVSLAYYLESFSQGQQQALPIVGALALGAQRLLPSLQQIYFSWSTINGAHALLSDVVQHLPVHNKLKENFSNTEVPLKLENSIVLSDVSFTYSAQENLVLSGINLKINRGERVGFIGETGSGKSTLVDIVMGLLLPTNGEIIVDDLPITPFNIRSWQGRIAHVPQSIFLSDASITENIAFGVSPGEVNFSRVKEAASRAKISEFIESLPEKYSASVGENGVRLSGGQRQRLGIARALYKEADILVLDEATSALDTETELSVMRTIDSLDSNLTVIIIAHRLSTLKSCTKIVKLKSGKIEKTGSFEEIVEI